VTTDALRARHAELSARLRRCGGLPIRDGHGAWQVNPELPAAEVQEWLALAEALGWERPPAPERKRRKRRRR
jgi:hypothetical protein